MPIRDNVVTFAGNATREPELRFTNTGLAMTTFGLAMNESWQNKHTNEREERTTFVDIQCWRQLAENVADSVSKGARVTVVGRLEMREWEDKTDGSKRTKLQVVADDVSVSLLWATATIQRNDRTNSTYSKPTQSTPAAGSGSYDPYDPTEVPF